MTATVIPPPVKAPRCAAASMPSARPLMTTTPARASSSPSCSATASPYGDGRREPTIATRGPSGGGQRPFVLSAGRLSGGDIVQPETERFEDVALLDLCRAVHVRGRPCDAPGAMESPRGQAALRGPAFEASASSLAQRSEAAQRARFELRVEHRLALVLPPSRRDHSLAHPRRLLAARLARERLEGDAADGNLEVDPVEERPGQASPIGVDGGRRAAAGPDRIPAPAARARVRGRGAGRRARCAAARPPAPRRAREAGGCPGGTARAWSCRRPGRQSAADGGLPTPPAPAPVLLPPGRGPRPGRAPRPARRVAPRSRPARA